MKGSVVVRLLVEEEGGERRNPDCNQWFMGPAKGKDAKGGSRSRQIMR